MAIRWGIVSAGLISRDFAIALGTLPKEEHVVHAIAARDLVRASALAAELKVSKSYGSYEELAKDPEVDVVYIGSINTEHLKLGKLFLEAGKPIVCEKPLCMNKKEVEELISLAKKKNLLLVEAIWSRFNPLYVKIREAIKSGAIGDVLSVQANFGVPIANKDRVSKKEFGGSATLDIGVYAIQFATMVLGKPDKIHAVGTTNEEGVDDSFNALLSYKNGKCAVLAAHTHGTYDNQARIFGTEGSITVPSPFWCPTQVKIGDETKTLELQTTESAFHYLNSVLLRYEAAEVGRCLKAKLLESPLLTWQDSLDIAEIEDEIVRQINS